jgi:2'-5' RNA ligase
MKYVLVCDVIGEAEKYHQKLVDEISKGFDVKFLVNQHPPTHFTLKDPFTTNNIEELEMVLEEFCNNHQGTKVRVEGYNRFKDKVIFMNVCLSCEAYKVYEQLIDQLRKLKWMEWSDYDGINRKFHFTIAAFDIEDKYKDICRYLKNYDYSFEIYFDNITIYRDINEDGNWELYKRCRMHL